MRVGLPAGFHLLATLVLVAAPLAAGTPELLHRGSLVLDLRVLGGDNDRRAEPGETFDLTLTLNNEGTDVARLIRATLTSGDPRLSISGAPANVSFPDIPVGAFGTTDPTNVDGLAGKYRQGFGTPFDLDVFKNTAGIDVNHITQVRLVDVVGNGTEKDNWPASQGGPHFIYDPFHTAGSGGFDLEALGVRHFNAAVTVPAPVPLPAPALLLLAPLAALATRTRTRG